MSHHIVEIKDLYFSYSDGTNALNGVSFRITHGESVALVGENGAGKSTLLLHLNGYLSPNSGSVRIGDCSMNPETLNRVRKTVGMVFQNPDDQLFMPTVYEDVVFGPLNLGLGKEEADRAASEALHTVAASHLSKRPPYKLSQGEKRSVAIATVLAMSPDILVMDEPSSSLDPFSRRHLIEMLKTFHHTKIIATHDLELALDVCQRVIVMHEGKITADGPILSIFQDEHLLSQSKLEKPTRLRNCAKCGDALV